MTLAPARKFTFVQGGQAGYLPGNRSSPRTAWSFSGWLKVGREKFQDKREIALDTYWKTLSFGPWSQVSSLTFTPSNHMFGWLIFIFDVYWLLRHTSQSQTTNSRKLHNGFGHTYPLCFDLGVKVSDLDAIAPFNGWDRQWRYVTILVGSLDSRRHKKCHVTRMEALG